MAELVGDHIRRDIGKPERPVRQATNADDAPGTFEERPGERDDLGLKGIYEMPCVTYCQILPKTEWVGGCPDYHLLKWSLWGTGIDKGTGIMFFKK